MRKGIVFPFLLMASGIFAQTENLDTLMMSKIRDEGMNHSQVMEIVFNLTDASGPRLMQSPGYFKAANWAKNKLSSWGLVNANLEAWGNWGKGWELEKYYLAMTSPYYKPLIGFPKTFSNGTNGLAHAQVILLEATDSSGFPAYAGKLKDKIILIKRTDSLPLGFTSIGCTVTPSIRASGRLARACSTIRANAASTSASSTAGSSRE